MGHLWRRNEYELRAESARLLLLSRSSRFPNGLANGSGVVGRNATFHEYSAAIGAFEDPVYGWAGGGYVRRRATATAWARLRTSSLPRMCWIWVETVFGLITSSAAISSCG